MSKRPSAPRGCYGSMGGAMGDTAPARAYTVGDLVRQVNRFGDSAPVGYRYAAASEGVVGAPFDPAAVQVTMPLAIAAVLIYQRRASDAYSRFGDQGSLAALNAANGAFADPVGFVTSRLAEVVSTISSFGDSLGIPAADGSSTLAGLPTWAWLAIAGGLLWWVTSTERRRDLD